MAMTAELLALSACGGEGERQAAEGRRFSEAVGEPPLAYLTRWRMQLAAHRLRATTHPVESIAHSVGYRSEYAFNRAFARHRGQPPGRYRRTARNAGAARRTAV